MSEEENKDQVAESTEDAIKPVNLASSFNLENSFECNLNMSSKNSYEFAILDIARVKDLNFDVLINCQYKILRGLILSTPKYGIWSFHHDDERIYRGGPSGFWEILNKENCSGSILQILTDKLDAGKIIRRGYFSTNKLSLSSHRDKLFFESSNWINSAVNEKGRAAII